ncbi:MAG TPA: hypothetical protein VJS18_00605, partial [Paraburkholderia sp.]|nr:hypothetical protein [Paraburkholderia sp.]
MKPPVAERKLLRHSSFAGDMFARRHPPSLQQRSRAMPMPHSSHRPASLPNVLSNSLSMPDPAPHPPFAHARLIHCAAALLIALPLACATP